MRILPAMLIVLLLAPTAASEAPPTPFEIASLCHLNRLRADPAAEAELLADLATVLPELADGDIDLAMFRRELAAYGSVPPMVMESAALTAARNHSRYMALHSIGHGEDPAREGFTGRDLGERLQRVAFSGKPGAENVLRSARDPMHGHLAFVIDWGDGPGGMQPERGHRVAMLKPRFNVVGLGAAAHGEHHAVTHAFGIMDGRFMGVVAYRDIDGDGCYDPGEGRPLELRLTTGEAVSGGSTGMVTLRLPGRKAGIAELRSGAHTHRLPYPPGILNAWFEWRLPADGAARGAPEADGTSSP